MDENNSSIFPYLEGIEEWEFKWNELISIHSLGQVGYQGGGARYDCVERLHNYSSGFGFCYFDFGLHWSLL